MQCRRAHRFKLRLRQIAEERVYLAIQSPQDHGDIAVRDTSAFDQLVAHRARMMRERCRVTAEIVAKTPYSGVELVDCGDNFAAGGALVARNPRIRCSQRMEARERGVGFGKLAIELLDGLQRSTPNVALRAVQPPGCVPHLLASFARRSLRVRLQAVRCGSNLIGRRGQMLTDEVFVC
jgi:hypothetical protein